MVSDDDVLRFAPWREELERAQRKRDEAEEIERATIRRALQETRGMVRDAAKLLGMTRDALHTLLRRRYSDLATEARGTREAVGYRGGNPNLMKSKNLPTKH